MVCRADWLVHEGPWYVFVCSTLFACSFIGGGSRLASQWRKKATGVKDILLKTIYPEISAEQERKGTILTCLIFFFYVLGVLAMKFVQPSLVLVPAGHILAYKRQSFDEIDLRNPITGEARVALTKHAASTGRVLETLDTLTVNLAAPADFRFGDFYEDQEWIGVSLIRLAPSGATAAQQSGFVSVRKAVTQGIAHALAITTTTMSTTRMFNCNTATYFPMNQISLIGANSSGSENDIGVDGSETSNANLDGGEGYFMQ